MVNTKKGKISQVTGVLVQLSDLGGMAPEVTQELMDRALANRYSLLKQILVDFIDGEIVAKANFKPPGLSVLLDNYLSISMPCGNVVNYPTAKDIPEVDVPCPCGDKTHWIIRYRDLRKEVKYE